MEALQQGGRFGDAFADYVQNVPSVQLALSNVGHTLQLEPPG